MSHEHPHHLPCLHCHPHSYIRMCLVLRMSRDDCIKALSRHASIQPLVTLTVWKKLLKENKDFFQTYLPADSPRPFNLLLNGCQDLEEGNTTSATTPGSLELIND